MAGKTFTTSGALLFYFSLLYFHTSTGEEFPLYRICRTDRNYTENSSFEANLNHLLLSIPSNGSLSGFYNDTVGDSPDRVYGLVLCRGDVNATVCRSCISTAAQDILQLCPNSKGAVVWYDPCLLRYSDRDFFSPTSFDGGLTVLMWNTHNVSQAELPDVNPQAVIDELLRRAPTTQQLYVNAELQVGESGVRYGYAQCTRDLNSTTCRSCLNDLEGFYNTYRLNGSGGWRVLTGNCIIRYEAYPFLYSNSSTVSSPAAPSQQSEPPSPISLGSGPPQPPTLPANGETYVSYTGGNKKAPRLVIILILVAATIIILVFLLALYLYRHVLKKRPNSVGRNGRPVYLGAPGNTYFSQDKVNEDDLENTQELPLIDLETIITATDNFSIANKLGEGGFGPVYKGTLPDSGGKEIAIKRLSTRSRQGQKEFMNEVLLIAKLQHKNLVRLLFCCMEKEEMMLVYEYMPNKSLDVFIFDETKRVELDWERRLSIIGGVARGVLYLHEDSRLTIIHRDLKASNVLLDNEMNPKISDFGMARIFGGNQIQGNTNRIVGTYGYISPEYAMMGLFSVKSDVFSFGVLLLEILSGKKNSGFYLSDHGPSLIQYAWHLWCSGKQLDLIDPLIAQQCHTNKVLRCIHIGLLCVQEDAADRPTMSSVVFMLASESEALPPPKEPAFSVGRSAAELARLPGSVLNFYCTNKLTTSESRGR